MRPKAEWAIDSEPIRARGIIVKYHCFVNTTQVDCAFGARGLAGSEVIIQFYFFPRGHGNEFSNLIGCLRGPDFPISAHGHGNAYVSFRPFVYKAI